MTKGKSICNVLKTIRKQVADANGIKYEPRECHHQGIRCYLGKAVAILGVSASLAALTSCAADNDIVTAPQTATNSVGSELYSWDITEEMPSFPGGPEKLFEYLKQHMRYPKAAGKDSIEGRVIVSFIVEKNGKLTNFKVVKSPDPSLSKEALRVAKSMPKWNPGKDYGKPVRVKYTLPITFRLK